MIRRIKVVEETFGLQLILGSKDHGVRKCVLAVDDRPVLPYLKLSLDLQIGDTRSRAQTLAGICAEELLTPSMTILVKSCAIYQALTIDSI